MKSLAAFRSASAGFAVLALAALLPLRAEIEFTGILAMPQKTLFALTDTATGKSDWVPLGAVFSGHTVVSHHAADDTLTLARNGAELRVRLKDDAKVKPARLELTGTVTLGTGENLEVTRATLLFDQENIFPLKDGMLCRITPQRRDDGTIEFRWSFERMLGENKTEKISAPAIITLPGQSFGMRVGDLQFAFTPR